MIKLYLYWNLLLISFHETFKQSSSKCNCILHYNFLYFLVTVPFTFVPFVSFLGPAFNIFLRLCNFQLGPFVVNKYTSPGVSSQIFQLFKAFLNACKLGVTQASCVLGIHVPPVDPSPVCSHVLVLGYHSSRRYK